MKEQVTLPATVFLIDANFLNLVIKDTQRYFEPLLNRQLKDIDLADLITYLALDAEMEEGDFSSEVIIAYDDKSSVLASCVPGNLREELDGKAFKNNFGEFAFATVQTENLVPLDDFYIDLLSLVADHAEVKKLVVISYNEEYGDRVTEVLKGAKSKEVIQFRMDEPEGDLPFRWEILAFSVMQALGIRGEELN